MSASFVLSTLIPEIRVRILHIAQWCWKPLRPLPPLVSTPHPAGVKGFVPTAHRRAPMSPGAAQSGLLELLLFYLKFCLRCNIFCERIILRQLHVTITQVRQGKFACAWEGFCFRKTCSYPPSSPAWHPSPRAAWLPHPSQQTPCPSQFLYSGFAYLVLPKWSSHPEEGYQR